MLVLRKSLTIKKTIVFMLFAIVFGAVFSVSHKLIGEGRIYINIIEVFGTGIIIFLILMILWEIIQREENKEIDVIAPLRKKEILAIFLLSVGINIICLLTYYPGVGMNDGLNIMYYGMSQAQQFPVFYCIGLTILKKVGIVLGSLQYSVAIYSILQIICVSALYTWIYVWFSKKQTPKIMKWLVLLYFLLEPLLAMYAISMLKDTLFSLFLFVLVLLLYDLIIEKNNNDMGKMWWIFFAVILFGILSFRNNGSYIVFPILLILIICCTNNRKKILFMIMFSLLVVVLQKLLMIHFGAEQLFQEIVAIPLQQMAAVVANNGKITVDQQNFLSQLMPLNEMISKYNPGTVDTLKWDGMFNRTFLNEHKIEFLETWAGMLVNNFTIYVKAYLQQTFWFWAPWQEGVVQCFYSIETVVNNTWLTDFLVASGIHDQPLLPEVLDNILKVWYGWGNKFVREGVCFWIMLGSLLLSVMKNKTWKMLVVYAPMLLLWLTIMISTPVASSMRYVFVFAYALPFFLGVLFIKNQCQDDIEKE